MRRAQCVVALLALCVRLAPCSALTWDIVLANNKKLGFYYNGQMTGLESPIFEQPINWLIYDPVHNRVLYSTKTHSDYFLNAYGIDSETTQRYFKTNPDDYLRNYAYDPFEELLFATSEKQLFVFSLKSGTKIDYEGTVVNLEKKQKWFHGVAVDSCRRYIYWISDSNQIERARYDGTGLEVIVDNKNVYRHCLTIEKEKLYWVDSPLNYDYRYVVKSADLDGKNEVTLYTESGFMEPNSMALTKDFIYWMNLNDKFIWKLPRNSPQGTKVVAEHVKMSWRPFNNIATKYEIEDLNQTIQDCKVQRGENDTNTISTEASKLCQNYCVRGDCSVSVLGPPRCSCEAGYSGDRCETYACHNYCLHGSECSLNGKGEPVCRCTFSFQGERCDVPDFLNKCVQTVSLLKDFLRADVSSVPGGKAAESTCASPTV